MYRKHFGLLCRPFELSPDAGTFFLSEKQKQVLAGLRQGLSENTSLQLLTGSTGVGKTALLEVVIASPEIPGHLCLMTKPVAEAEFLPLLGAQLQLMFCGNKAKFLVLFAKLLKECREDGQKILLIIDDAHMLPRAVLEDLRLLANLASQVSSALCILLVGRPELLNRLSQEQLFMLNQRLAVRYHLGNFSRDESRRYIHFRLHRAGAGNRDIFTNDSAELVYEATGGNPRLVNMLCDDALFAAYSQGVPTIDADLMRACVERLHVGGDDDVFLRPPEVDTGMRRWLIWVVLTVFLLEGVGVGFAYQKGWLLNVCQYLMRSIKLG